MANYIVIELQKPTQRISQRSGALSIGQIADQRAACGPTRDRLANLPFTFFRSAIALSGTPVLTPADHFDRRKNPTAVDVDGE